MKQPISRAEKESVIMSIVPDKKVEQVQFCESHATVWAGAPTTIGLTAAQCTAFATLTTNARKAYDAAQAAKQAYRAAVTNQNAAIALAISGPGGAADLIRFIKSFAENTATPDAVYGLAQIPPPAIPQPVPAPGQPSNVTVNLEPSGAITLKWKAVNAAPSAGTFFTITRKLSSESMFTLVGNTGEKFWTDVTLTQGTPSATYIIQGHRGAINGPESEQIGVQFGMSGGGGMIVSNAQFKMAA
jgi:hypothetical protein